MSYFITFQKLRIKKYIIFFPELVIARVPWAIGIAEEFIAYSL
jgi:hypothetical protein